MPISYLQYGVCKILWRCHVEFIHGFNIAVMVGLCKYLQVAMALFAGLLINLSIRTPMESRCAAILGASRMPRADSGLSKSLVSAGQSLLAWRTMYKYFICQSLML